MKLTLEENRESIKRYGHVRPAPRWGSVACSARCPGTLRSCTLERGHGGPHVAHGWFRRVLAVWDKNTKTPTAEEKAKTVVRTIPQKNSRESRFLTALRFIRDRVIRRESFIEEVLLFGFALSMVWFAIDMALHILGWR